VNFKIEEKSEQVAQLIELDGVGAKPKGDGSDLLGEAILPQRGRRKKRRLFTGKKIPH